jgi:hypothetical protein
VGDSNPRCRREKAVAWPLAERVVSASGRTRTCTSRRTRCYRPPGSPVPADAVSSTGGSRTRTRQGLSLAALPVCVPCQPAPCTGLEPVSPARQAGRHTRFVTGHQFSERPAGVEPARPPWRGGRQPLHHGRVVRPAGAVGVEPTPGRFGGGRAAVTPHPCSVRPEGLEPSHPV